MSDPLSSRSVRRLVRVAILASFLALPMTGLGSSVQWTWTTPFKLADDWGVAHVAINAAGLPMVVLGGGQPIMIYSGGWTEMQSPEPDITPVDLAMNDAGDALLLFKSDTGNLRACRYLMSKGWEPSRQVSIGGSGAAHAKIDAAGNAVAVWTVAAAYPAPWTLWGNRFDATTGYWHAPVQLMDGDKVELAMDRSGNATAVSGAQAIRCTPAEGWGPVQDIPGVTQPLAGTATVAAVDGNGNVLVANLRDTPQGFSVWSSRYTAAGGWSAAETISGSSHAVGPVRLAVNGAGAAVAAWVDQAPVINRFDPLTGWGTPEVLPGYTDYDGICKAQKRDEAGTLLLNGDGVSLGAWRAAFGDSRRITIDGAGDLSLVGFTIKGVDRNEVEVTESLGGPKYGSKTTSKFFQRVTEVSANGALETDVEIGYRGPVIQEVEIGIDADGTALAAWCGLEEAGQVCWTARCPLGSGWSTPRAVGNGLVTQLLYPGPPQLAVNAEGEAVITWIIDAADEPTPVMKVLACVLEKTVTKDPVLPGSDGTDSGLGPDGCSASGARATPVLVSIGALALLLTLGARRRLPAIGLFLGLPALPLAAQDAWISMGTSASGGGVSGSGTMLAPSLAVTASGQAAVAWMKGDVDGGAALIYLRVWNTALSEWTELLDSRTGSASASGEGLGEGEISPSSLAIDASGNPVLAWSRGGTIYVQKWDSRDSTWAGFAGSATGGIGNGGQTSLALDRDGNPAVAWAAGGIFVRQWDGETWIDLATSGTGVPVDLGLFEGWFRPSIALDPQGHPVVAYEWYCSGLEMWDIHLRRWNGGGWEALAGSDSMLGEFQTPKESTFPSVAIDAAGNPIVAWQESAFSSTTEVYLLRWDGTGWVEEAGSASDGGVSGHVAGSVIVPSLKLDGLGRPIVAWTSSQVLFAHWDGLTWAPVPAPSGPALFYADRCSLAIDGSNNLYTAWSNSGGGQQAIYVKRSVDLTPPAAITNVNATPSTPTSIVVQGSYSGDDGYDGMATAYNIRFSSQAPASADPADVLAWWEAASAPAPDIATTPEGFSLEVAGLSEGRTYYFAARAVDEAANCSAVSNVASATVLPARPGSPEPPGGCLQSAAPNRSPSLHLMLALALLLGLGARRRLPAISVFLGLSALPLAAQDAPSCFYDDSGVLNIVLDDFVRDPDYPGPDVELAAAMDSPMTVDSADGDGPACEAASKGTPGGHRAAMVLLAAAVAARARRMNLSLLC